jgi:hypothetical protein
VDFIERWFGASPDGGNGTFEMVILIGVIIVVAIALAAFGSSRTRR